MKNFPRIISTFVIMMLTVQLFAQGGDCEQKNKKYRFAKDKWIIQNANEPFSQDQIDSFSGLFYYPINCDYVVTAELISSGAMKVVNVETTDGATVPLYDYGTVKFNMDGKDYMLQAYKNIDMPEFGNAPETVFIPFRDATSTGSNSTTFSSGRYLILQPTTSGSQVVLDFNAAVNPFENYNSGFSSLVVPRSNVILAPIPVGERKYEDR
jgi:uncharacterized protein (DUF1684 family)